MIASAISLAAGATAAGELVGRVTLDVEGASLVDLGPTVLFLEGPGDGADVRARGGPLLLRQLNARFEPEFLVVAAGHAVEMPNEDSIFHNVFSFSRPNDFDLGMYPAGASRSVAFQHAGVVRVYCSIHESMAATLLVTPSPWFARVSATGDYRIENVPPGAYRLTAWNEKLPAASRPVTVVRKGTLRVDFSLGVGGP